MKIKSLDNKKIAILGFGVTGKEVFNALSSSYNITIINETPAFGCKTISTQYVVENNIEFDIIIKSPGVLYSNPILQRPNQTITNDIELSYEYIFENKINTKIVAITGTNGKTTTTQFITNVLNKTKKKAIACGNIGLSPLQVLKDNNAIDYLVMELSSYQLKQVDKFHPQYGMFLNISSDHIDYHGTFDDYLKSKCNLFKNMNENDTLIIDENVINCYPQINWPFFSSIGASLDELREINTLTMPKQNYKLIYELLKRLNISESLIIDEINNFGGLEHRLELVMSNHKFKVINDSKATNITATNTAIKNLDKMTTLIVGGSIKKEDYTLLNYQNKFLKNVIAYGQARNEFTFIDDIYLIEDFNLAVKKAIEITMNDEILLLSPGCASFDQHKNYEQRGQVFKEIIKGV